MGLFPIVICNPTGVVFTLRRRTYGENARPLHQSPARFAQATYQMYKDMPTGNPFSNIEEVLDPTDKEDETPLPCGKTESRKIYPQVASKKAALIHCIFQGN